jgi:hypothetical protein
MLSATYCLDLGVMHPDIFIRILTFLILIQIRIYKRRISETLRDATVSCKISS